MGKKSANPPGRGNCDNAAGSALDGRHRTLQGRIQQKRGDTLNKNLSDPIDEFSPNARLDTMREKTSETSVDAVRKAAKNRRQ